MSDCFHIKSCPLFPIFTMQSSLAIWQTNYCRSEFERCARYKRSLEGRMSPMNLLPNGTMLNLARRDEGGANK